jgi:hypothetical protein
MPFPSAARQNDYFSNRTAVFKSRLSFDAGVKRPYLKSRLKRDEKMPTNHKPASVVFVVAIAALSAVPRRPRSSQRAARSSADPAFRRPATSTTSKKGHFFFVGKIEGVFVNDVAGGFLDKT